MKAFEIREATESDAGELQVFISNIVSERLAVLFERETPPSIEDEREFVRRAIAGGGVVLVAVSEATIVGLLDFHPEKRPQSAHGGQFGMSVAHEHRGQGIGKALIERLLGWAQEHGFTRVELQVFENNTSAIHLYERMGFQHEGRRRQAVKVAGQRIDVLLMAHLSEGDAV